MNLKELKDRIDDIWNNAELETKVDKEVLVHDPDNYSYYPIEDVYVDSNNDVIIRLI